MLFLTVGKYVTISLLIISIIFVSPQLTGDKAYAIGGTVGSTETKTIPSSGAEAAFSGIVNGATYTIAISGTFRFNSDTPSNPMWADAQWLAANCSSCSISRYNDHNNAIAINGVQSTSGDFKTQANPSHVYTWTWKATTTSLKLKIVDSNYADNNGSLTAKVTLTALPNKPPTANAGPDKEITLPTNSVTLVCSGADPEGGALTYSWTKTSGSGGTISSPSSASTTVTGLTQGSYVYTCKVTDNKGVSVTDTVTVKVNPAPPVPQEIKASLDLLLHGIGKAGDSVREGAAGGGNMSPTRASRAVTVSVFNPQNQPVVTKQGTVNFDSQSGSFRGIVDLGSDIATGPYILKLKMNQYLVTQVPGAPTLTKGQTANVIQTSLVTGDINNDGAVSLDVRDYSILVGCVSMASCTNEEKLQSDLDDNGKVDQFDFNLFIREISHTN